MTPEEYLGRVRVVVWEAAEFLPAGSLDRANRLIEHGEPAEGLRSLAWAIVNANTRVPRQMIDDIRSYTSELIEPEFLPGNLEEYAFEPGTGEEGNM